MILSVAFPRMMHRPLSTLWTRQVLYLHTVVDLPSELALTRSVDQALDSPDLSLSARVKCLRRLYRTCGSHGILPKRLKVPACYDHNVYPLYKGGYADVWKGEYCGRDVAVKVIRTYSRRNLKKIIGVSH